MVAPLNWSKSPPSFLTPQRSAGGSPSERPLKARIQSLLVVLDLVAEPRRLLVREDARAQNLAVGRDSEDDVDLAGIAVARDLKGDRGDLPAVSAR